MASSSSVPIGGWTYDVFLSFRGEDTRNNFVDHLHTSLVQKGICVFKDDYMLRRGKPISSELLKAIEESRFAVVVFSKNYANSSWCLDELAKIMECQDRMGQKILPVFYHVDPSDVRGQKRDFATAFQQHEEKFREEMDKVNDWRKALAAAANLSGWHISPDNGGESLFINKIVQEILSNIHLRGVEKNLIGIQSRINELNSLLDIQTTQEVRMVGICGMGGIGKTTIAQALFRRISYKFEGSSFVKDVRENSSSKSDVCALQEQILKDVLATHHETTIKDPEDGAEMIQTRFCNKRILLVLDDVHDVKQLEFLAATHEWFGAGSRIIITTRDERLLSDTNAKYKPAILLKEQAVELFSRHAFRKNSPPEGYEELSNRAICYTACLPLALKVLGSFFRGREAGVWESALNRLAKTPDREIFETLKISFDGLEESEKKIFLDVACFFKGDDVGRVTRVLDSCGFDSVIGISVLIEKSLITVSSKKLNMHDLVQEMGLKIVHESYPNSRLWKHEAIYDCIEKKKKLKAIEAIVLPEYYSGDTIGFSADVFKNMNNLRLLHVGQKFTSCSEPTFLPDELRWLHWDFYPFTSLHLANLCKLGGIEVSYGNIEHLLIGHKAMPYLKFVHLEGLKGLKRFPDVSWAPNIERLDLLDCRNLVEVHESLGSHKRLVYLDMRRCISLKFLPSKIDMENLETLDLSNCCSLLKFPEVSPGMVKLSNIYLDGCVDLENIPHSICELKYLKRLHLYNCTKLQKLPKEIGSMENLEELWLGFDDHYGFLKRLSKSIKFHTSTNLRCLRKLDLSWRQIKNKDFPHNLDAFSSLEEVHLSGNSQLLWLPASISCISRLKHLELNNCRHLQSFLALPPGLQVLKASNCKALEKIEDLTKECVWLYKIWLTGCKKLLQNQDSERCLVKLLEQSFLKKCVAVDHVLSIAVPGNKIPSWFKEQRYGHEIALKLPPKCHGDIMGFVVCGVFQGKWMRSYGRRTSNIFFKNINIREVMPELQVDHLASMNESVWIVYIPFSFFRQQKYDDFESGDWSLFVQGTLLISILANNDDLEVVRCGTHIVYKEDVELIQEYKTCIPDYRNSNIVRSFDDAFEYRENRIIDLPPDCPKTTLF